MVRLFYRTASLRFSRTRPGLLALGVLILCAGGAQTGYARSPQAAVDWHALGSAPCAWSPPVTNAEGAIDASATIRILKANGLNCYGALIRRQRKGESTEFNWASFKSFVATTQAAGINVWAILLPPSEGGDSPPFNEDYVRWMQELARLSVQYPCLKGVNIDDFSWDYKFFTPQYTRRMYSAKQEINPRLQFTPTIYGLDQDFSERYGDCVDGVWLWWRNLENYVGLDAWLKNSRLAEKNHFPIYGGVYAHPTSWHPSGPPAPHVFLRTLEATCQYANGAIIWQMVLAPPNPLLKVARSFGKGGSSPLAVRCGTLINKSAPSTLK